MFAPSRLRWRLSVTHLVDKVGRANTVLLLGVLWSALGICVLAALSLALADQELQGAMERALARITDFPP
jgi:hypothetical protein